jgi:hypothetical protein
MGFIKEKCHKPVMEVNRLVQIVSVRDGYCSAAKTWNSLMLIAFADSRMWSRTC